MEQGDQAAQPDTSQSTGHRLVWQEVVSCSAPWHTLHTGHSHHTPASVAPPTCCRSGPAAAPSCRAPRS